MAISTIPSAGITGGGFTFRNLIINGDMSIAQRGTSFSDIAHDTYFLDRYRFHKTNTSELVMNLDQSTDVPSAQGLSNSLKLTVGTAESATASNELVAIGTKIEAQNLQQLKYGTSSAETLTLSFWVKSSVTGTYTIMVFQQDASSSPDRRYYSKSFSINSANTWEKKTIQITGNQDDTIANDNGIGFDLRINLSAGSSYTSGSSDTWGDDTNTAVGQTANFSGTSSATFFFTGVQLEVGTSASDFEFLPYDVNYQRCIRYCNALLNYGAGDVNNNRVYNADYANGNGMARMSYPRMRNQPSITYTLVNATGLSNDFSSNGLIQLHAGDNNFYIHSILLEAEL